MALSPMMQEYQKMKQSYSDCILMYRVGDFYEMFFDDALTASKDIELTLTGKDCGLPERAPMCGVPFHALDVYVGKLLEKGHKVAICDQVEDPKEAKGLVKREVTRVVTPGTNLDMEALEEGKNNYLMAVVYLEDQVGVAAADVTTGAFYVTEVAKTKGLLDEIQKFLPSEIICNEAMLLSDLPFDELRGRMGIMINALSNRYFDDDACRMILLDHFHVPNTASLDLPEKSCSVNAAGGLLSYLLETQKNDLAHINRLTVYQNSSFMRIDGATLRNLELVETMRDKQKKGSLWWVLDHTKTAMGARFLRSSIEQPLLEKETIEKRLDAVDALVKDEIGCAELGEYLNPVYDLERLMTKVSYGTVNPRDMAALKTSLAMLPAISDLTAAFPAKRLKELSSDTDALQDIWQLLEDSIAEDPPFAMKEGGMIRDGYDAQIDELRSARTDGKDWLADLEKREREKTGIHTLKVKFNRVFGYCIEVTNTFKHLVPDDYIRRQTLVGGERYTTPELKELENKILGAQERLYTLEYEVYTQIRSKVFDAIPRIQKTASAVAEIDLLYSLACAARRNRYVRPSINTKGEIHIRGGRHPVVEKTLQGEGFIPNDTDLDGSANRVAVITGPNMAGKSTYMRQTALITLMAQIGSFVPADSADIAICDRIFTRVGASDDLASGQSTFMLEMTEMANILRNATSKSLLILDEIGRGTSTFDGLAIAWAVIEYIADRKKIGAKTLFATHYHELTELEGKLDGVKNYCIAVKEKGDGIIFLRKIIRGGADKSYGVQVARLAGVPEQVLKRAEDLVEQLTQADITDRIADAALSGMQKNQKTPIRYDEVDLHQMSLFDAVTDEDLLEDLMAIDVTAITPLEALNVLNNLQNKWKNRWKTT